MSHYLRIVVFIAVFFITPYCVFACGPVAEGTLTGIARQSSATQLTLVAGNGKGEATVITAYVAHTGKDSITLCVEHSGAEQSYEELTLEIRLNGRTAKISDLGPGDDLTLSYWPNRGYVIKATRVER